MGNDYAPLAVEVAKAADARDKARAKLAEADTRLEQAQKALTDALAGRKPRDGGMA